MRKSDVIHPVALFMLWIYLSYICHMSYLTEEDHFLNIYDKLFYSAIISILMGFAILAAYMISRKK